MYNLEPKTSTERYLASLARSDIELPLPITRKEKFLNDFRESLYYQFINDIYKLPHTSWKKINNNPGSIGNIQDNTTYVMFGENLIYVKAGSRIELLDTDYALQFAKYDKDTKECIIQSFKDTSSNNLLITIDEDCYIRFCVKCMLDNQSRVVTQNNLNDYLDAVKVNLILDKLIIPAAPSTAGTYTLTATVDANGIATYSWVSQT